MGSIPFYGRMTTRDLVTRAERYAKKAGLKLSTVSRKILLDGGRLKDLKTSKSRMFPETLEAAEMRLAKLEDELESVT